MFLRFAIVGGNFDYLLRASLILTANLREKDEHNDESLSFRKYFYFLKMPKLTQAHASTQFPVRRQIGSQATICVSR